MKNIDEIRRKFYFECGKYFRFKGKQEKAIWEWIAPIIQEEREDARKEGFAEGLKASVSLTDAIRKTLSQTKGGKGE